MADLMLAALIGVAAYYAGYLHGFMEGKHYQRWMIGHDV